MGVIDKIKDFMTETRYYDWHSLPKLHTRAGSWDTIDISDDEKLIQKLWDGHISKVMHLNYYLSSYCIECTVLTPRGLNYLKWKMSNGEPCFLEYGIYSSLTRYDIAYPEHFSKCEELRNWLIEKGNRFVEMYEQDKNL